ncbi:hypothetical protein fugu_007049 [Takifugu bimaculatus]|uniref:Uncharacterized protein n=1 Tax=Takifugu bimaculatus TaxID=433685 RepID=A0A4Z2B4R8_9TELE|nr:hypothetical protein fugu_007049 [Takifugu bimaculatus]
MHFIQRFDPRDFVLVRSGTFNCSMVPFAFRPTEKRTMTKLGEPLLAPTSQIFSIYFLEYKKKKNLNSSVWPSNRMLQLNNMADNTNQHIQKKIKQKITQETGVRTWITGSSIASMRLRFHPTQTHTRHWTTHFL